MVDSFTQKGIQVLTLESGATLEVNYDKLLGQGSFGAVFSGKYASADGSKVDGDVAIKVPLDKDSTEDITKETQINFIQGILYEQSTVGNTLYIVMPNLGVPIPNSLSAGQNLTDIILEDSDFSSDSLDHSNSQSIDMQLSDASSGDFVEKEDTDNTSGTFLVKDDNASGTFLVKDDNDNASGTFLVKDDNDNASGTVLVKDDTDNASGTVLVKDDTDNASGTFLLKDNNDNAFSTFVEKSDDNTVLQQESAVSAPVSSEKTDFFKAIANAKNNTNTPVPEVEKKPFLEGIPAKPLKALDLNKSNYNLRLGETVYIFEKMAAEVEKIHNNGILHLDIKGENFIRNTETGEVRLIDFGVSEFIADNEEKDIRGSLAWIAPELILQKLTGSFTTEQDVYSLGRTYIMALAGPLAALNKESITIDTPIPIMSMNFKVRGDFRDLQDDLPQLENIQFKNEQNDIEVNVLNQLISVMNRMTQLNPANRPSMSEVRQAFQAMRTDLKQIEDQTYLKILEEVPFQGNKLAARVMAQNAVRSFNLEQEIEWRRQPENKRPSAPNSLEMPENAKLDAMVAIVRNSQAEKSRHAQQIPNVHDRVEPRVVSDSINNVESAVFGSSKDSFVSFRKKEPPVPFLKNARLASNDPASLQMKQEKPVENKADPLLQQANEFIAKVTKDVEQYHQKSMNKNNQQTQGVLKSFMVKFQSNSVASTQLSAELYHDLQTLADKHLNADEKLSQLKSDLQDALKKHLVNHKGTLSKGGNSDFHKICKTGIEHIEKLQKNDKSNMYKKS